MEKITFDSGMQAFQIGNGVLRFNPADPGVYSRFLECGDRLQKMEEELSKREEKGLDLICLADKKMKEMLSWVFGPCNDFDQIMGGVNLLSAGQNGERVIINLLSALQPILVEGAKQCARGIAEKAQV